MQKIESGCVNDGKRIGVVCLVNQNRATERNKKKSLKMNLLNLAFAQKNLFDFLCAKTYDDSNLKSFVQNHHYIIVVFKNCVLDSKSMMKSQLLQLFQNLPKKKSIQLHDSKTNQIVGEILNNDFDDVYQERRITQHEKNFVTFIHDLDNIQIQKISKNRKNHSKQMESVLLNGLVDNLNQELKTPALKKQKSDTFIVLATIVGTSAIYLTIFLFFLFFRSSPSPSSSFLKSQTIRQN